MTNESRRHTAGLFDVRNIIGTLLGIYGVVLVLVGLIGGSSTNRVSGGDSSNLWVGVALVLVSAFFLVWARLRPTVVDDVAVERERTEPDAARPDRS